MFGTKTNINIRSVQFYCPRETTHYFERIYLSMQRKNMLHLLLKNLNDNGFFYIFRLLWFLRGHSIFSTPPQRPMTSDSEGFSIPDFIHYIYFPILILEKEPVFPF